MLMSMRILGTRYWLAEHWDNFDSQKHVRRCGVILNPYHPREHDFSPPIGGYNSLEHTFSGWLQRPWTFSWQTQTSITGKERRALKGGYYWNSFLDWTNAETAEIYDLPGFDDDGNMVDEDGNIIEAATKE